MSDVSPELNQDQSNKDQIRSTKNADKSIRGRIKKVVGQALLAGLVIAPGTIHDTKDTKVSAPNIQEPTPASAPLPKNTIHNTELIKPSTPTKSPTQEVSTDITQDSKQEQSQSKELTPYSPSITIIDAAPSVPSEGLIQKEFVSNDEMIRNMLGDKYISKEQIIQEFGQNYEEKWDEVVEKYPETLVYRFADTYFNHGENVTRVIEDTLKRSGLESTGMNVEPLQKIFDKDSITFIKDASGNPGISFNFDPKRIIKLLENDPSRVINGSFQVGNVGLFQETKVQTEVIPKYDPNDPRFSGEGLGGVLDDKEVLYQGAVGIRAEAGRVIYYDKEGKEITPISYEELEKRKLENSEVIEHKSTDIIIEGAYTKEKAMENLPKLFEVANAYPDKFFVFAGGNSGEDFREAMENLRDQVPKNLLITAEWVEVDSGFGTYKGPAGMVYGADVYVNNTASDNPNGSSFSVPELSAEIDILLNKGLSFEQAREKILASSDTHTVNYDGKEETARVFNPSKIQEK